MDKNSRTVGFVTHPRYGNQPLTSQYSFSDAEIKGAHWRYQCVTFFPETAIPADIEKQNFALYPRTVYVDIEQQCIQCKRVFIFYALEQQHWFEVLGFYVDAHCTKCTDCRKKMQEIKHWQNIYGELILQTQRTEKQTKVLKQAALELLQLAIIKDKQIINKISK